MNEMVPGLAGGKMSSSDPNSKIDFLDPPEVVRKKVKAAFCEEGNVDDNGLLSFVKTVLIPISQLRIEQQVLGEGSQKPFVAADAPSGSVFTVARNVKYGGPLHYSCFKTLEDDFKNKVIHPGDLKASVGDAIVSLLTAVQKILEEDQDFKNIERLAYPPPPAKPVKAKKEKVGLDIVSKKSC